MDKEAEFMKRSPGIFAVIIVIIVLMVCLGIIGRGKQTGYAGKNTVFREGADAYILPVASAGGPCEATDDLMGRKIIEAAGESINGIRIIKRVEDYLSDVICQKRDDTWYVINPIVDRADKQRIDELIQDITGLTVAEFVDNETRDLSQWGLDRPRLRIDLTVTRDVSGYRILIGDSGPGNEGFYVRTKDSSAVYLVKPQAFSPLELITPDLIERQLVCWDNDGVIKASWDIKEDCNLYIAGESKSSVLFNRDTLSSALRDIRIMGIGEVLKEGVDFARYGLDNPTIRVHLDLGRGSTLEIKIGKGTENGFYATVTNRDFIYLVERNAVETLDKVLREFSS